MSWRMLGTSLAMCPAEKSAKRIGFDFGVCRASAIPALGRARLAGRVLPPYVNSAQNLDGAPI